MTGSAQGMGEAHIRKLIDEGAKVVITDIFVNKGEELAEELGDKAIFIELDVTDADSCEKAIKQAQSAFGPVDICLKSFYSSINNS